MKALQNLSERLNWLNLIELILFNVNISLLLLVVKYWFYDNI